MCLSLPIGKSAEQQRGADAQKTRAAHAEVFGSDEMVKRILQGCLALIGITIGIIFLPMFPVHSVPGDPVGHDDPRITANLSDNDLQQVLRIVRRGRLNSAFEIFWYHARDPLLHVSNSMPTMQAFPVSKEIPAKGQIRATVGTICGHLCGSGVTYYLTFKDGAWAVVDVDHWIS